MATHKSNKSYTLNRCPFCKTDDFVDCIPVGSNVAPHGVPHQVRCTSIMCDDVKGPAKYGEFEAIEAWNKATDYNETDEIKRLKAALRAVTSFGGNLSNEALMTRTGPNDAAARGIMYVNAREVALAALKN